MLKEVNTEEFEPSMIESTKSDFDKYLGKNGP